MADIYVDGGGGGSNTSPYDTTAKAASDLQSAINIATAGDTIWCKGTQTLTSGGTDTIELDTGVSTTDGTKENPIRVVGVNSSWVDDGTKFLLDGADANANSGITITDASYFFFKNIRCSRMSANGLTIGVFGGIGHNFDNCEFDNNATYGLSGASLGDIALYRCSAHHNGSDGFYKLQGAKALFCIAAENTGGGFTECSMLYGCLAYKNDGNGLDGVASGGGLIINCVADRNLGYGFALGVYADNTTMVGCRATNNGNATTENGIACSNGSAKLFHCFAQGNYYTPQISGVYEGTNLVTSGIDGYTDVADGSEDYNLTTLATMRQIEVRLPTLSAEPT